jgi:hypothetical protein
LIMEMDCPKCGLANLPSAQRCDCGYDFGSRRVERSFANPDDSTNHAELGMTLAEAGLRNMRIGPVVCLGGIAVAGISLVLPWFTVSDVKVIRLGPTVLGLGVCMTGVAQFFRGLAQYRRGKQGERTCGTATAPITPFVAADTPPAPPAAPDGVRRGES